MGNSVFPELLGLEWPVIRTPTFQTIIHRSVSGRELRASFQQYPIYNIRLSYEFLTASDHRKLVGFYLARQGSFDSFLFTDPEDNSVTDMMFGEGNGSSRSFQIIRSQGEGSGALFAEPVMNIKTMTNVKVDGVIKTSGTHYNITDTGLLTFTFTPSNGAVLTWTGTFYYRCRFSSDHSSFEQFSKLLWNTKQLELIGSPGNKV